MRLHYPEVLPPACTFLFKNKNQWRLFESSNKSNNAALFFLLWRKWIYKGFVKISTRKKKGSQSGLRVASLHWYVKKRDTQNTLQKKTHDYNPITKRKDKQQPNEYKHNHNRRKIDNNYLLKLLYRQCNWFDSVHINRFANSTVLIYPDILANDNSKFQKEAAETLIHESGEGVGK